MDDNKPERDRMTKDLKTIDLNLLPIVTLGEMANEAAEQVEKNAKATVQKAIDCGRYLTAIKEQLEHGQWGGWLGANWNYSQKTAAQYMQISNFTCGLNLKDASSINDALRMIADSKPETVPRAERKPADVVVTVPNNDDPHALYDIEDDEPEADDDPTPDPPSIRKTAKGSEKISEDKKPRTQQVPVEIVDDEPEEVDPVDEWFQCHTLEDIVTRLIQKTENAHDQKKTARALRKWADKLDPPTKFVKPDLDEVSEYFRELKSVDPESFFDFYESKGWLVGKVSMKDWRASARKWVRENSNGSNGNGKSANGNRRGFTAEEVFG